MTAGHDRLCTHRPAQYAKTGVNGTYASYQPSSPCQCDLIKKVRNDERTANINIQPESPIRTLASALMVAYNNGANTWDGLARVALVTVERLNEKSVFKH